MKINEKSLLVILIVLLVAVNFNFLNNLLIENFDSREIAFVGRVVDGDTVVINGSSVRMLGINTPERGERYSDEATEFLESLVMDKTLVVENYGEDFYGRELNYLYDFESRENINLKIVEEGYGNYYFPSGGDKYSELFFDAWDSCVLEGKNLCEKSEDVCSECVYLKEFDFSEDRVVLKNNCDFSCDLSGWEMKDEGRKKFIFSDFELGSFEEVLVTSEDFNKSYVWTYSGDTLFLRDDSGKLVLWERSGY